MIVAASLAVVALIVVLVALARDRAAVPLGEPHAPHFDGLPTPSDLARLELPTASTGYDPASVEATLDAVRMVYAELWRAAGPAGRYRAAHALARRQGAAPPSPPDSRSDGPIVVPWRDELGAPAGPIPVSALEDDQDGGEASQALRAVAGLAVLDPDGPRETSAVDS